MNHKIPDVHSGFRKGRGTRDQIANTHWSIEKVREFQKNICFIYYAKAFDLVDYNKRTCCKYMLFQILSHCRFLQDIAHSSLCCTVGPCCSPILCTVET